MSGSLTDPQACLQRVPVPGWPEFELDEAGSIFRVAKAFGATAGKKLNPSLTKNGYAKVSLCRNGKRTEFLVHRLVAMAFIGPIPDGLDVCHYDGDKQNNAKGNLRIDTRRGNVADNVRLGKFGQGERAAANKYPESLVVEIKARLASGERVVPMSKELGIPASTLYAIRSKQTWAWL